MRWIGYQYWLNALVSPGARKEKSGWLSVNTPAISSTYGPSESVRFRSQAWPHGAFPQVHCFLPGAIRWSAQCTTPACAAWSYPPKKSPVLPRHMYEVGTG